MSFPKHIAVIVLALSLAATASRAQSQYSLSHNLVCWDSAGVITTLVYRTYEVVGFGVISEYRNLITNVKVVPTVGTISDCAGIVAARECEIPDMEILPACWDSSGILVPLQVITEYSGDTTTINYYRRNGTLSTATGDNVSIGECGPIATSLASQLISNSLVTPTVPAGTEEVVVFNYSTAFVQITFTIGTQIVGPQSSISIHGTGLSATGISVLSGTFTTGNNLVLNYSTRRQ